MNGNIRVGHLFGIPFYINVSWFLVLALVTWSYSSGLSFQFPQLSGGPALLMGLAAALLLFASVLAHELGHSFVALRQGIGVRSITLFLFGGLASLEKEAETPAGAFWVAIAGPLVSLALFGLLTLVLLTTPIAGPVAAILRLLAFINLALAVFNLIPGLPLDGGNVLKAAIWKLTGNPYKGIVFASRVGQVLGWIAVIAGLLSILGISRFGNFWTLLIGWFLLQNAGRSAQSATVQEKLEALTAADAVTPNSPVVSAQLSLREFADEVVLENPGWRKFLVTDETDQLLGAIAVDDLRTIPKEQWSATTVRELVKPNDRPETVQSGQTLLEIIGLIEEKQLSSIAVIRENGTLVGLLERSSIIRLLRNKTQAQPA